MPDDRPPCGRGTLRPMAGPRTLTRRRVPIGAAVDIGAHSVHLLVAEVHGHRLVTLDDESAALGLGGMVDEHGELGFEAGFRLVETLAGFAATARSLGAGTIAFVATDPLRRAADAGPVIDAVEARTGVRIDVLEHEEEASLALLGVQAGSPIRRETLLVDVGGGSTELLIVGPGRAAAAYGLPLGAARLSKTLRRTDPPSAADVAAILDAARTILATAPDAAPDDLVAVGGTASNLLRIGPPLVRQVLTVRRIEAVLEIISTATSDAVAARFGVKPSRARVLPGGAAILLAVAERYGRDHVRVSTRGIREGLVLASTHAGPAWRDRLAWLAHGWSL